MGAFRDAITAALAVGTLTEEERRLAVRRIKGQALFDNLPALPYVIDLSGNNSITVESASWNDPVLTVVLSAIRRGQPAVLDNPFVFINPPIHVLDATGDLSREVRDRAGMLLRTDVYAERPLLALRRVITDAVRLQTG